MSIARRVERIVVDFFGESTTGKGVSVFRILFGALSLWVTFGVWINLERFWGKTGLIPFEVVRNDAWNKMSLITWAPESSTLLVGIAVALGVASLCTMLGVASRLMMLVIGVLHISLQFRNPLILNSGDRLFQILAMIAVFMPLDNHYSLTAWWRRRRGRPMPIGRVYGARLLQLQIAYVYISSCMAKISNVRWRNGMALRDVLASPVFAEWPTYIDSRFILYFLTYSTLVFEFVFPVAIWWKRLRPFLLLWGIGFHVGIDVLMIIPMFSSVMIVSYPAFLSDEDFDRVVRALKWPWRRWRTAGSAPTSDEKVLEEPPVVS